MASETQHGLNGARGHRQRLRLILDLTAGDSGTVSGTVGLADGSFRRPFHGWIDLMSAVNALRAAAGPAGSG
jgi:hypothetical protein